MSEAPRPKISESVTLHLGSIWRTALSRHLTLASSEGEKSAKEFEAAYEHYGDPTLGLAAAQIRGFAAGRRLEAINFMGTTGCGKSTIAAAIAKRNNLTFAEADTFHTSAARSKMSQNVPLEDSDRITFLEGVQRFFQTRGSGGAVTTCSALKERMRFILRGEDASLLTKDVLLPVKRLAALDSAIVFVHMDKPYERALYELDRAAKVAGFERKMDGLQPHYIKVTRENPLLLQKQYEILEPPKPWEAVSVETQAFYDAATDRYDEDGMRQFLLEALGLRENS